MISSQSHPSFWSTQITHMYMHLGKPQDRFNVWFKYCILHMHQQSSHLQICIVEYVQFLWLQIYEMQTWDFYLCSTVSSPLFIVSIQLQFEILYNGKLWRALK